MHEEKLRVAHMYAHTMARRQTMRDLAEVIIFYPLHPTLLLVSLLRE